MAPPSADSGPHVPEAEDDRGVPGAGSPLEGVATLILGCGSVGSAFAGALQGAGAELCLWSRNGDTAERLARRLGARRLRGALPALDAYALILIAVTDDALRGFVESLAGTPARREPASGFLFHTHGASGLEVLAPLAERGWELGKLHPLRAVRPYAENEASGLRGAWFASAASNAGEAWATRVIEAVGGYELRLGKDPEAALRLHAAAALLSGGLVALFDQACEVARGVSRDPEDLRRALLALVQSTAANLAREMPQDALTGPVARGSKGTLERHLGVLEGEARELYRLLGRRMLGLAARRGSLPPDVQRALGDLLGQGPVQE